MPAPSSTRLVFVASLLALFFAACSAAPPVDPDGGTPDAGKTDGGAPDAGEPDAGGPDAGMLPDAGPDAGQPDGGSLSCDGLAHDAVLGTAQLGGAWRVVDSATLPVTSLLPVAVVAESLPGGGAGLGVYGYSADGHVHRLGTWPQLQAPAAGNRAFDAVTAADRALQVLITAQLAQTQGQLLAGYRTVRAGGFVDGGISVFDTARPDAGTRWLPAPGIESTLGLGSYFLVGADALGGASGGRGVYQVKVDDATLRPGLVATYPAIAGENVRPGLMALTQNGIVVLGYYLDLADRHSLRLPEPAQLADALSGGAAVNLATLPELTTAADVRGLVSFGQGVAVLHTTRVRGILPALGRLEHYPLTRVSGDAGTQVGAAVSVLTANDEACTVVSQLVPVPGGMTVIVGLWDKNGQRLVRLAPK